MPKREKLQYILVLATDLCCLILSVAGTWLLFRHVLQLILPIYTKEDISQFMLIVTFSFFITFLGFGQAENITRRARKAEALLSVQFNLVLAAIMAVFLLITKARMLESRYLYVGILCFNSVFIFIAHTLLKKYLSRYFYKGSFATLVGIVTTSDRAELLVRDLKRDWSKQIRGVAVLDAAPEPKEMVCGVPVVAGYDDFMDWIRRDSLDEIYFNIPYATGESLLPFLDELESMGLTIHLNVPVLERFLTHSTHSSEDNWIPRLDRSIEEAGDTPFVTVSSTSRSMSELIVKRIMDIVGGLIGALISLPIIAIVAIPLKLESRGPLIFKQQRVGLNGRVFNIYKLRSMYQDAEQRKKDLMAQNEMNGLMFKITDDPRITKVGRFIRRTSIDELPQFFNVLRGDMSLVGTRPPTLDEYERYQSHHKRRLSMKPGITGMWQVSGRSDIEDFEEVVRLDVQYIDNWSLKLDIKIILKTIGVVFSRSGAK
ncbi:MAG: sugar transferase [Gemmiger sp.]